MDRVVAAVGLGSNLGDRQSHLEFACRHLQLLLSGLRVSSFHETAPYRVDTPQPDFLNAAAVGETTLAPRDFLAALLTIEQLRGRQRPHLNAPRTLDLDLILFGTLIIDEPGLLMPHPRFRERRFVLAPLAEIAGWLIDPVSGQTVGELLAALALGG